MADIKNKSWKNPTVLIVVGSAIIGLATFFVSYHIQPIAAKVEVLQKENIEMKQCINERPTKNELRPELKSIKENITEIKEAQKENDKKLDDIYKLLLTIKN